MRDEKIALYQRLASEQHTAAIAGGVPWRKFVAKAERETQVPWEILRELLDPYCRAFYAMRDASNTESQP